MFLWTRTSASRGNVRISFRYGRRENSHGLIPPSGSRLSQKGDKESRPLLDAQTHNSHPSSTNVKPCASLVTRFHGIAPHAIELPEPLCLYRPLSMEEIDAVNSGGSTLITAPIPTQQISGEK